jgi:hypothetical protein
MILLLLFGRGRERTEADFRQLLDRAGWNLDTIVDTGLNSIVTASART